MSSKSVIEQMDALVSGALEHKTKKTSPAELLGMAMKMEEFTKQYYQGLAKKVTNKTGSVMFRYLAAEEASQIKELSVLLKSLKKDKKLLGMKRVAGVCTVQLPREKEMKGLRTIVPKDANIGKNASDLLALWLAIEVKTRSVGFYCAAMKRVGDARGKKLLSQLAAIENRHLNELNVQYTWLDHAGFWYDASMMTD
jgi:rubrerythrin